MTLKPKDFKLQDFSSGFVLSHVQLFAIPWTVARQAPLSSTISQSLLRFMSIQSMIAPNHLILYHPILLPSTSPSIRVFSSEVALRIRWPKYYSFSISISSDYPWLISFRIDWLGLLAVQGSLKSLLQHHSLKLSVLQCSVFFMAHLLHGSDGKESACNAGNLVLITGLGRSPGEGNGNPPQYSCLDISMDGEAWQVVVHGVTKSWTQLSN